MAPTGFPCRLPPRYPWRAKATTERAPKPRGKLASTSSSASSAGLSGVVSSSSIAVSPLREARTLESGRWKTASLRDQRRWERKQLPGGASPVELPQEPDAVLAKSLGRRSHPAPELVELDLPSRRHADPAARKQCDRRRHFPGGHADAVTRPAGILPSVRAAPAPGTTMSEADRSLEGVNAVAEQLGHVGAKRPLHFVYG